MKNTNWKAVQVIGTLKPGEKMPTRTAPGVKAKYMAGGSWRADMSKGGTLRKRGGGGA